MIFDVVQSMNKCSSVSSSAPHKIHSISPICFLLYSSKGDKVEPLSSEPNPEPRDSWCPSLMDLWINPWARTWPKRCFCPKPHVCANSKEENVNALIRFFLIYQSPKRCKPEKKKKKIMAQLIMVSVTVYVQFLPGLFQLLGMGSTFVSATPCVWA